MSKILAQGMITLTQLYEGVQVILTPTAVLIPCDSEENPKSNAYVNASTNVKAFLGTMDITSGITLGELEYSDSTVRASKTGTKVSITTITTRTGYVDIPVSATINGETIDLGKHRFNFVKQIDGQTGQPGAPGDPGFGYTLNIKGGTRGVAYAANGTNPEPKTSSQFSVELLKNGVKVANPASISWTCGGNLSGSSSAATFTPTIKSTYASESSYVKVSIKEFAASLAVEETIPIICTKHADGLDWINEWNNQYVQVGTEKIITPKIFAGTKNSANELTGVAIGRDVLGGNANKVIGIVGYKKNTPVFSLDQDANFFVSSSGSAGDIKNGTNKAKGIYFDGNNLYVSGKVKISGGSTIGESNTLVEDVINNSNLGAQANNKIDNLSIGGRNLAKNSIIINAGDAGELDKSNYISSGTLITTISRTHRGFRFDSQSIYEANQQYVLSFYIQKQSGTINQLGMTHNGKGHKNVKVVCDGVSKGDFAQANTSVGAIMDDGNIHKIEVYFTTSSNIPADSGVAYTYIQLNKETGTPCSAKITKFKLEKGTKPTDWSPAPEDINSAIDSKANSADVYKKTETYSKTQTESAIEVAKNEINLGISSTYETKTNVETKVNNAINNIQVGGINLLTGTKDFRNSTNTGAVHPEKYNGFTVLYKDFSTATSGYSDVCTWGSAINVKQNTEYTLSFYAKGSGDITSYFYSNNVASGYSSEGKKTTATDGSMTHTLTNNWKRYWIVWKTLPNTTGLKNVLPMRLFPGATGYICGVKFEEGNKATDWSPAPEDVAADIATAKNEAINSANSTLTTTIANYYTKEQTDSQINIAKEAINLGVSNTYETKANVETKVNNAVNNIQIGGRNLIRKADLAQNNSTATYDGATNTWTINATAGAGGWWGCGLIVKNKNAVVPYGKAYVLSFEIKVPRACSWNCDVNNYALTGSSWSGNDNDNVSKRATSSKSLVANQWIKCWIKWENTNPNNTNKVDIYDNTNFGVFMEDETSNMTYQIRNVKGELGNMSTEWTPAPEDVDSAINSKANSNDVYKKTEVYTRDETNSQINIAKNDITLSVSNTYETKTNVENKINTAVNNVQIGGRNLALGTGKATGDVSSGTGGSPYSATDLFSGITAIKTNTAWTGRYFNLKAIAQRGGFKAGDNLVLSVYIKADQNVTLNVTSHRTKGTGNTAGSSKSYTNFTVTPKWQQVWFPFVADEGSLNRTDTRIEVNVATGNNYIHWAGWKLEKGTKPSDWTPAPEDIDSAIGTKANSNEVYNKSETYTKSETNTQIKAAKDEINLSVSNTYETKTNVENKVSNAVSGLKVGGNNLLRNGNFAYEMANWSIHDMNSGGTNKSVAIWTGGSWVPTGKKAVVIRGTNTSDRYGVISSTMKLTPNTKYTISGYCAGHRVNKIQVNVRDMQNSSANIHAINIDPAHGGNTLDKWYRFETTFTTTANTDFALNLYSINLGNDGYVWFTNVQVQEGTKATAWTPCSEDIDASINSKANSAEVYKKTEVYTKNETNSQIKAAKDEISLSVSNTYETKTNVETKVNNAVNNIQVGGRNIATSTNQGTTGWGWGLQTGGKTISEVTENGIRCCKIVRDSVASTGWSYISYSRIGREKYLPSKKYTISFEVKSSVATQFTCCLQEGNATNGLTTTTATAQVPKANTWTKLSFTLTTKDTLPTSTTQCVYLSGMSSATGVTYIFRNLMIEEGTKASSWTPAPEDINSAINSKANSTDVYTKTETNTQINMAKDSITNTVSQNYLSKGDASNTYATKSTLTQTTNSIVAKFESSGGYNLLKNSKAQNGTNFWVNNGGGISTGTHSTYKTCFKTQAPSGMKYHESIKLKNNTEYVYEGCFFSETAISGSSAVPLHYWCMSTANTAGQSQLTVLDYRQSVPVNRWTKCYVHFRTASSGDVYFTPFVYVGGSATFVLWATELSLSESSVESKWSPHPSEIYEGSTIIDATGVTVNNGALRVKNKSGSTVLSGDSNGNLVLAGNITSSATISGGAIKGGTITGGAIQISSTVIDSTGLTVNNGAIKVKNKAGNIVLNSDSNGNLTLSGSITSSATISGGTIKGGTITGGAISGGTIQNSSTTIDSNGLTVSNGAIRVKNKSGTTVLSGDSNGNLVLSGNITSNATISGGAISGGTLRSTSGDMYFDMNNGIMILYNNGTKVGQTNKNSIGGTNIHGVTNGAEYGSYSCLAAKTSSNASSYSMMLTASGCDLSGTSLKKGITLGNTLHSNNWHFRLGSSTHLFWRQNGSNHDSFITEGSEGMLRLYGDNGMYLGYRVGDSNNYIIAIRENGNHVYPKSLSIFDGDRPATDNNGYSLEISAPLNMKGQSINQCSNIKTLGLEFIEPIAFNRNRGAETRTLKVTKNTQNIVEFIGSTAIKNGEAIVDLPSDVSFKNYVVLLTPIGLDRKVSIIEKNDDNFKIVGDDGIVDYVIKFESMDYANYIRKSISEDNTDIIVRSEEDKPKEIFVEN